MRDDSEAEPVCRSRYVNMLTRLSANTVTFRRCNVTFISMYMLAVVFSVTTTSATAQSEDCSISFQVLQQLIYWTNDK